MEGFMDNENRNDSLKNRYIEEIHDALLKSKEKNGELINYDRLNDKILISWRSAHLEGVSFEIFADWVSDALPGHEPHLEITKLRSSA